MTTDSTIMLRIWILAEPDKTTTSKQLTKAESRTNRTRWYTTEFAGGQSCDAIYENDAPSRQLG